MARGILTAVAAAFPGSGAPVQLIAVPEPGVAVTLLGGVATLLGLRRRKH